MITIMLLIPKKIVLKVSIVWNKMKIFSMKEKK